MRLKGFRIGCLIVALFLLMSVSFAAPTTSTVAPTENAIELISPEISPKGEVYTDKNLYISVRLLSDIPAFMTLTKIEGSIIGYDAITAVQVPSISLLSSQVTNSERFADTIESLKITKDTSSEEQLKLKKETLVLYTLINEEYLTRKIKYEGLFLELKLKYGSNVFDLANERSSSDPKLTQLLKYSQELTTMEIKYKAIKPLYDKLFERVILDAIPVKLEGVLPYYTYQLNDPKSGKYRMTFHMHSDLNAPIKTFQFEIKKRQDTVKEIINSIQEELDELWKIKQ